MVANNNWHMGPTEPILAFLHNRLGVEIISYQDIMSCLEFVDTLHHPASSKTTKHEYLLVLVHQKHRLFLCDTFNKESTINWRHIQCTKSTFVFCCTELDKTLLCTGTGPLHQGSGNIAPRSALVQELGVGHHASQFGSQKHLPAEKNCWMQQHPHIEMYSAAAALSRLRGCVFSCEFCVLVQTLKALYEFHQALCSAPW
jgi:hypothetical protein